MVATKYSVIPATGFAKATPAWGFQYAIASLLTWKAGIWLSYIDNETPAFVGIAHFNVTNFARRFSQLSLILLLASLTACAVVPSPPSRLELKPVDYQSLPGWENDNVAEALPALQNACRIYAKKPDTAAIGTFSIAENWRAACAELLAAPTSDNAAVHSIIEQNFQPYAITNITPDQGLFTGYYEPQLAGSLTPAPHYPVPLWQTPKDLITVNLGAFKTEWQGQRIAGKLQGQKLVPYDDRAAVALGSLKNRAEPLVWVADPVAAFFLEIQGSGRVSLPDGTVLQVGYAAQNGHAYVPIGRVLAEQNKITRPVSMQKIRDYLTANPEKAQAVMNQNSSVVFFRKLDQVGAVGSMGTTLTPRRSLAVDPAFVPLGTPLWLVTDNGLQQLMVAEDTGGAIKGPLRGDVFWGHGEEAEHQAGIMQSKGTYYLLLPRPRSS